MLSKMENHEKMLIETLNRGTDSAKKLQDLLRRKVYSDGFVSVDDLVLEILGSFSGSLSVLNSCDSGEFSRVPVSSGDQSPEIYTGKKPVPVVKERRGCYKRRRTIDSRVEVRSTMDDKYAWRKYGQKEILNSKFPRCYFRCTHKIMHGCKAQKQVQKLEDNPDKFHITYFGHHSCPTPTTFSHPGFVLDFKDSKNTLNFSNSPSTITNIHVDHPSIKQEADSKTQSYTNVSSDNVSSANDSHSSPFLGWNDVLMDEMDPQFMGFDREDSCASTSAHGYLDFLNEEDGILNDLFLLNGRLS